LVEILEELSWKFIWWKRCWLDLRLVQV